MAMHKQEVYGEQFDEISVNVLTFLFLLAAKFMEKDQKHCPLVTLYSTIQEKQVSLDTVSWPPR